MVTSKSLRDTSDFLNSISKKKSFKPSDLEFAYYLLAKEFGITLDKILLYPVPYLIGLISTHNYIKEEDYKAQKAANRKR